MRAIEAQPIEWHCSPPLPGEFRCHLCRKKDATIHKTYQDGVAVLRLVLCPDCAALPDQQIGLLLKGKN